MRNLESREMFMNKSVEQDLQHFVKVYSEFTREVEKYIDSNLLDENKVWDYIEDESYKINVKMYLNGNSTSKVDKKELLNLEIDYLNGFCQLRNSYPKLELKQGEN